jgi:hypothetical protein
MPVENSCPDWMPCRLALTPISAKSFWRIVAMSVQVAESTP